MVVSGTKEAFDFKYNVKFRDMETAIKVDAEEKSFCWDDGTLERVEDGKISTEDPQGT